MIYWRDNFLDGNKKRLTVRKGKPWGVAEDVQEEPWMRTPQEISIILLIDNYARVFVKENKLI
jgi:hypothetical protein